MIFSDPPQAEKSEGICYRFGPFQLNPLKRVLLRKGEKQALPSKVFDTLLVLLENRHRVVDKDELLSVIWGERLVAENNLNQKIAYLRRALGESPRHHEYIVTIPGEGYRFVATVKEVHCEDQTPSLALTTPPSALARHTIAIVPFDVLGVAENEYLGLCLADALITRLSKMDLPGLVLAQAANAPSKAVETSVTSKRRKSFQVGYALSGRIRKFDQRTRINAQLLDVEKGLTIWAEQFDETLTDWLVLEDKIAEQIAHAVRLKLTGESSELTAPPASAALAQAFGESRQAHQLCLRGQYFCDKGTLDGLKRGMGYFQRAIESDPKIGLAYGGMAQAHLMQGFYGELPQQKTIPMAEEYAFKALAADTSLSKAHLILALVQMAYYFDWEAARAKFKSALKTSPEDASGHQWYAGLLTAVGEFDAAREEIAAAQQCDPLSLLIRANNGLLLYLSRNVDEAIAELKQTIEMDDYPLAHLYLGLACEYQGQYEEAIAELVQAAFHYENSSLLTASFIYTYARAGEPGDARRLMTQLQQHAQSYYVPPYYLALAYAGLGEKKEAILWLQKAHDNRCLWMAFLKVDPRLDILRSDPDFIELLKKMKLDQGVSL